MTKAILGCLLSLSFFVLVGCGGSSGGGGGGTAPGGSLSLMLSNPAPLVFPSQGTTNVTATISRTGTTGNVSLTVTGLPSAAVVQIQSPGSGNSGTITIGAGSAAAGNYSATVVASDGSASASSNLTLAVGATTQISNTVAGRLQLAMSTSFQPAEWDYQFFTNHPSAVTPLGNLQPQNIRLQPISKGIPQTSATTWDFSYVDAIAQPVLTVGDHSPEFQIALAPSFMYDNSHNFLDPTYGQFAAYTQDLVRYYNLGGFTDAGGTFHKSAGAFPITWWGIYNEPNYNNVTPSQYVQIYNTVVPAMHAVDPSLKFAAIELGGGTGNEQAYLPPFVSGVTAQVDVVATHYYSSCNQSDSDTKIFATVPMFASQLSYIRTQLATNPALSSVPVWVTENNVNADFQAANGNSSCNPNQKFVLDKRGSSAFFAAWRPYVFSQMGKAGAEALYHWDFPSDAQYGELDDQTGATRLSYWVDFWLERMFPANPGANILQFSSSDTADLETLAVRNPDNSVVVMIANYAVASSVDNNGPGLTRMVSLDTSGLGTFSSASLLKIDATTDATNGPVAATVAPGSPMQLTLSGYGVVFVKLQ
jgi:hypothetical protein